MRVVEEHAELGVACRRWGVPLVDGGTQRLPRIIGMGRAMDLILTGRSIKAPEALSMGLANEVVPKGAALGRCLEIARLLCAFPQTAMRTDKRAAQAGFGRPLAEGLRLEAELARWALQDAALVEGAKRFLGGAR
jgi:enoyl-CoA hydratase